MAIIIDRSNVDNLYIDNFDTTFVGDAQLDFTG